MVKPLRFAARCLGKKKIPFKPKGSKILQWEADVQAGGYGSAATLSEKSSAYTYWSVDQHMTNLEGFFKNTSGTLTDFNSPRHSPASEPLATHDHTWIYEIVIIIIIFYHVGWESRGRIRGVWQRTGEARTGRGGESGRSGVRAEGWARWRPRQVFIPRGSQSRGPVSRTRIKSQRARGLVEVTLRIGHWWARDRSPIPKREEKNAQGRWATTAKIINNQLNNQPCKQSSDNENKKKEVLPPQPPYWEKKNPERSVKVPS